MEVNVAGRSFLVTGANSGLGKAAAMEIARRGERGCGEGCAQGRWREAGLAFQHEHKGTASPDEGSGVLLYRAVSMGWRFKHDH